ncbi:MAG: SPOCS domain-containing protein [Lachnospiraceae bacterium]
MEVAKVELIKKNIHMDRIKCQSAAQVSLEEDINIPDNRPDVSSIILKKAQIQIEEVKPTEDHVNVRGRLLFWVLYETREEGQKLVCIDGRIPFEEQIYLEGVRGTDAVSVKSVLEDLTVGTINSRKLSIQSLFTLKARVEELYDEEAPVDLYFEEGSKSLEFRKDKIQTAAIGIQKNDIFRIREEITLPQNFPNIFHILWDEAELMGVEFKPMGENILVQGDVHVFVLYEGEGENTPIRFYETTIPFSQTLECHGCREDMIGQITYEIGHKELEVRPDFDGEERMLALEMVMDIAIKLYEEELLEMVSDVYGVNTEVESSEKEVGLRQLLMKIAGKSKVTDRLRLNDEKERVLQLIYSTGEAVVDRTAVTEEGILAEGSLNVQVFYITGDDASPYHSIKGAIPFSYTLEVPDIRPTDEFSLQVCVGPLQVVMVDSEEMDVKAVLDFQAICFRTLPVTLITDMKCTELDMDKISDLPGMVIYTAANGDNLWNIGKRYYVPVERIKEINELNSDEIKPGDKLLIVKGM